MALTHKQRIEKAHIAMMRTKDTVWLAPVCMIGNVRIAEFPMPGGGQATAGTDGRDCLYSPSFMDKLNDAQLRATVVHENMHKAYRHLRIHAGLVQRFIPNFGEQQAHSIVNMAQDFVINREIKRMAPFLEMWDGIIEYCYDAKYDDDLKWDTVRIAEDIAANAKKGGGGNGGKGSGGFQLGDGKGGQDFHDWANAQGLDKEETEKLEKQIEQALRQGQALSRSMSGKVPRDIGELLTPAVDWRQALRDFVTERARGGDFATYAKPNRRYIGYGMYMPSTYTETVKSLGFFCDMSGSVGPDEVREVMSEIAGCLEVVQPETVDIIFWDTAVARHEHYSGPDVQNIMQATKPAGGGGTQPSCVVPYCQARNIKPTVAIWLSDGLVGGDWAEGLGVPAFWVITSGGAVPSHLPHVKLPQRI